MSIQMKQFIYPNDLLEHCQVAWKRLQSSLVGSHGRKTLPKPTPATKHPAFPDESSLQEMLNVMYHASMLTEETRKVAARVGYLEPSDFESTGTNLNLVSSKPFRFPTPIVFSVENVRRLAPAVMEGESLILVARLASVPHNDSDSALSIWGLLDLGGDWRRLSSGMGRAALAPPNCLTISVIGPGRLVVSALGLVFFRLAGGRIVDMPLPDLSQGHVGSFLQPAADSLYRDSCTKLGRKRFHRRKDEDDHPRQLYYQLLSLILNCATDLGHGGTFVILPDDITLEDTRLTDRLSIKYVIEIPTPWPTLIDQTEANRRYFDLAFPPKSKKERPLAEKLARLEKCHSWESRMERADEDLERYARLVATLSAVDGAVVLNKALRVLGFGAEITAHSPTLRNAKFARDPWAEQWYPRDISAFGTRHRSALRLASSFDDCLCFVISQDGPVRAARRVATDVIVWNDVNLGRWGI